MFNYLFVAGGGIVGQDHGLLAGLADDDHTQYALIDGTRAFTGDVSIGSISAGKNESVIATLGAELAPALTEGNWTIGAGWENPIVGPGLIKNADGVGTQTPSAVTTIVAGTTYKVVITLSALSVGSATYTVGGVAGTTLAAATTYTDYITASTTGKFIITPTDTSRFTVSAISIKALTDATGDLIINGNLTVQSPSTFNSLVTISRGGLTLSSGQLLIPNGTMSLPGLAFANNTDTGIHLDGTAGVGFMWNGSYQAYMESTHGMMFKSSIALGATAYGPDVILLRDAADTLALKNSNIDQHMRIYGANGTYRDQGAVSELLTIAAAASSTTTMTIPANAVVYAVSVRVTVVIPTAATFTVTGNTSGTQFDVAGGVSTAVNTTDVGTANCPYKNGAAQTIRITPNLVPANDSGRVRITLHYYHIQPSTS